MVCQTIKAGMECVFMTKKGCSFNGGKCHPIVEKCVGCGKIVEQGGGSFCAMYPDPSSKWAIGGCSTATHIKHTQTASVQKINPLKASKRQSRK